MTDKISSLADLRPGDVLFGPIGGLVGLGVGLGQIALGEGFRVGPLKIRHVGIVVEAATHNYQDRSVPGRASVTGIGPRLVQAMASGAEEVEMTEDTHWTSEYAYARLPEDYPGQARDAAAIARLMVAEKVPYSPLSYAALAAWRLGIKTDRLGKWIGRRRPFDSSVPYVLESGTELRTALPCEAICSVLVDQAWTLAGKKVMHGVRPQVVTPGALARQFLFGTKGVTWGMP